MDLGEPSDAPRHFERRAASIPTSPVNRSPTLSYFGGMSPTGMSPSRMSPHTVSKIQRMKDESEYNAAKANRGISRVQIFKNEMKHRDRDEPTHDPETDNIMRVESVVSLPGAQPRNDAIVKKKYRILGPRETQL